MIRLTRLNRVPLVVNSDLIEHIETTPDTVIALTTGQKFMVLETPDQVVDRVVAFRRAIHVAAPKTLENTREADAEAVAAGFPDNEWPKNQ
ncbi:MAG: flagellar FlbD family protein [Bryobacteraceae bacterium]|jgi:flagellar protein FlbD